MSERNVFPPENDEIDVKPDGTTIGNQTVQGNSTETQISPRAIGPVASFQLAHNVNNVPKVTPVTGVRIPFAAVRLEIVKLTSGRSQWKKGANILTAYASRTSRDWPQDLATPSTIQTNNQVFYTTAVDPTASDAVWTPIAFSDFTAAQIQISA